TPSSWFAVKGQSRPRHRSRKRRSGEERRGNGRRQAWSARRNDDGTALSPRSYNEMRRLSHDSEWSAPVGPTTLSGRLPTQPHPLRPHLEESDYPHSRIEIVPEDEGRCSLPHAPRSVTREASRGRVKKATQTLLCEAYSRGP